MCYNVSFFKCILFDEFCKENVTIKCSVLKLYFIPDYLYQIIFKYFYKNNHILFKYGKLFNTLLFLKYKYIVLKQKLYCGF